MFELAQNTRIHPLPTKQENLSKLKSFSQENAIRCLKIKSNTITTTCECKNIKVADSHRDVTIGIHKKKTQTLLCTVVPPLIQRTIYEKKKKRNVLT